MDKTESVTNIDKSDQHLNVLVNFITKILRFSNIERRTYFQTIPESEIKLLLELIVNFLNENIEVDYKSYSLLKRLRKFLYLLIDKKNQIKLNVIYYLQ